MSDTRNPPETRIVQDRFEDCIYRPGQVARCPARVPTQPLSPEQLDLLLEQGDQRVGGTVFRTECPFCSACEPVRIDIAAFAPSRAQRRVIRRNQDLIVELGPPVLSRRRVALWNRHRRARGLLTEHSRKDPVGYQEWLVESCAPTTEVRYFLDGKLVALSLLDLGLTSANSAYHFFDPAHADRSLGVYSVLNEIEECRARGMRWYYLGLWVEDCKALRYKSGYHPHERFVRGRWVPILRPDDPTDADAPKSGAG
ncbi:MAG: arginyltransferase [Pseudomonadota bacterium]|nr:arginyltransferase [Pseudomonadota bacterium]